MDPSPQQQPHTSPADPHAQLDWNLTNHTPTPADIGKIEDLRAEAKTLGHVILDLCPPSRERSLAITALEEASMWAVASIARQHPPVTK